MVPLGRPDWEPIGGYRVDSYVELLKLFKDDFLGKKLAKLNFDRARAAAQAAAAGEATSVALVEAAATGAATGGAAAVPVGAAFASLADAASAKVPQFRFQAVRSALLRGSNGDMIGGYYHIFRAEIDVPVEKEYEIQFGAGAALELGILYLDGKPDPIIDGSFKTRDAMMVIATQAKLKLAAGVHVFEMYTNRRSPEMRIRPAGEVQFRFLDGLDASL